MLLDPQIELKNSIVDGLRIGWENGCRVTITALANVVSVRETEGKVPLLGWGRGAQNSQLRVGANCCKDTGWWIALVLEPTLLRWWLTRTNLSRVFG